MREKKKNLPTSLLLLAAAAVLLLMSTVGSTRAALTYYSENYEMRIDISSIGVSLVENGQVVSSRNYVNNQWQETTGELLTGMLGAEERLILGKSYPETLSVRNSGSIDSYVRVILYRNWTKDGIKDTELAPELIELSLLGNGWVKDANASTRERTVLYYTRVLPTGGETTPFCEGIRIAPEIGTKVTETRTPVLDASGQETGTKITTTFAYDGYRFNLMAEVDAVQTHNAADAIRSAWGIDVAVGADGSLSLTGGAEDPSAPEEGTEPEQP